MDNYFNFQKTTNNSFNLDVDNLIVNENEEVYGTSNFYDDVSVNAKSTFSQDVSVNAKLDIQDITLQSPIGNPHYTLTLPPNTGSSGQFLSTNGAGVLTWASGNVGSVTNVSATVPAFLTVTVTNPTSTPNIAISLSGTALPTTSGGTGLTTVGTNGQVLTSNGSTLYWNTPLPGTVTSVSASVPSWLTVTVTDPTSTPFINITGTATGTGTTTVLQDSPTINTLFLSGTTQGYIKVPTTKNGLEIETEGYNTGASKFIKLTTDSVEYGNSIIRYKTQYSDRTEAVSHFLGQQYGRLNTPKGIAFAFVYQYLFIADSNNNRITYVNDTGEYKLGAGTGTAGFVDGPYNTAQFNNPTNCAVFDFNIGVNPNPRIYISDTNNHAIRVLTQTIFGSGTAARPAEGTVTTLAGDGTPGYVDGPALSARFNYPKAITLIDNNTIYVADTNNHCIRCIETDPMNPGVYNVYTIAGTNTPGYVDNVTGANARFNFPEGLFYDDEEILLYVCDTGNHVIRTIDVSNANYNTKLLAGTPGVPNWNNHPPGPLQNTTFFNSPTGIVSKGRKIFVADTGNQIIRTVQCTSSPKTVPTQGFIATLAGIPFFPGNTVGPGTTTQVNNPLSVARTNNAQIIYAADTNNHVIKAIGLTKTTLFLPTNTWYFLGDGTPGAEFGNLKGTHYVTGKVQNTGYTTVGANILQEANSLNDVDITTYAQIPGNTPLVNEYRGLYKGNIFLRTGGNWFYNSNSGIPEPAIKMATATIAVPQVSGSIYLESVQNIKSTSVLETTIYSYEKIYGSAPNVTFEGTSSFLARAPTAELNGIGTATVSGTAINLNATLYILIGSSLGDILIQNTSIIPAVGNINIQAGLYGGAKLASGLLGSAEVFGSTKLKLHCAQAAAEIEITGWDVDIGTQNNISLLTVLGSISFRTVFNGSRILYKSHLHKFESVSFGNDCIFDISNEIKFDSNLFTVDTLSIITMNAAQHINLTANGDVAISGDGEVNIHSTTDNVLIEANFGDVSVTAYVDPTFSISGKVQVTAGSDILLHTSDPDSVIHANRKLYAYTINGNSANLQAHGFSVAETNPTVTLLTFATIFRSATAWFGQENVNLPTATANEMANVYIEGPPIPVIPGSISYLYSLYINKGTSHIKGDIEMAGDGVNGGRIFTSGLRVGTADGFLLKSGAVTQFEDSGSALIPLKIAHYFEGSTLQSINPVTVTTTAINVYIHGPPVGSITTTITNAFSFYINAGATRIQDEVTIALPPAKNFRTTNDINTLGVNINPSGDVFINSPQNPSTLIVNNSNLGAGSLVSLGGASILKDLYVGGTIVGANRVPTLNVTKSNTVTYVMNNLSPQQLIFEGALTQDVYLPQLLTVTNGTTFIINSIGAGIVTVYTYLGITELSKIYANQQVTFTVASASEWTWTDNVENNNIGDGVGRSLSLTNTYTSTTGFLSIENTALTSNVNMLTAKATNITSTGTSYIQVGREASNNNMGRMQFVYDSLGSTNNYVSLGLIGNEALKVSHKNVTMDASKTV